MEQGIPEAWSARKIGDEIRHLAGCMVCREKLRPREDQKLYAVKNARTREFIHVLVNGESLESKLGWPRNEILYSLMLEDGTPKGPPMNEETKARLRKASEKRKAENKLKRFVRANTPARPAEGEKEETMKTKKKSEKKAADSFLPMKFIRNLSKKDYTFERDGDGWRMDGAGPMPLRHAMAKLIGEKSARATSFVKFFRADKIAAAGKKAEAKEGSKAKSRKSSGKKSKKVVSAPKKAAGNIAAQIGK